MNFRLVWVGSDDDSHGDTSSQQKATELIGHQSAGTIYERRGTGMVRREQIGNGRSRIIPLANFTARIVSELVLNDDTERRREFGMEAELAGQTLAFRVSAAEFGRMGWVLNQMGPGAIIYPGQQQHTRAAIRPCPAPSGRNASSLTWAGASRVRTGCICKTAAR